MLCFVLIDALKLHMLQSNIKKDLEFGQYHVCLLFIDCFVNVVLLH